MKRILLVFSLIIIMILSGCAGINIGKGINITDKNMAYVNKAIDEVKTTWEKRYAEMHEQTNTTGYLEIKNTRIIKINSVDESVEGADFFKDIDCIVEFVLFSDYFGTAPYYPNISLMDSVAIYKDGTCKMVEMRQYIAKNYDYKLSAIKYEVVDLEDKFNQKFDLLE